MTNQQRRRAFDLRLAGYSWGEIGTRLGYGGTYVERDLRRCLTRQGVNLCRVVYPALRHYISFAHEGSVTAFCDAMGYPRNKGRKVLRGELPLEEELIERIRYHTGLLTAEIQRRDETNGTMAV